MANKNKEKLILYYSFLSIVINTITTTWLKRNNHLFRNLTEWTFQISRYFLSWKKKIWLSGKFRDFTTNRSLLAQNISVIVIIEVRPHSPHGVSLLGIISTPDRINIIFYVQVVDSRDIPSRPLSIKPLDFIGSDLPFQHNVIHVVIKAEFPWTQVGPTANHIDTFRLSSSVVRQDLSNSRKTSLCTQNSKSTDTVSSWNRLIFTIWKDAKIHLIRIKRKICRKISTQILLFDLI